MDLFLYSCNSASVMYLSYFRRINIAWCPILKYCSRFNFVMLFFSMYAFKASSGINRNDAKIFAYFSESELLLSLHRTNLKLFSISKWYSSCARVNLWWAKFLSELIQIIQTLSLLMRIPLVYFEMGWNIIVMFGNSSSTTSNKSRGTVVLNPSSFLNSTASWSAVFLFSSYYFLFKQVFCIFINLIYFSYWV